MRCIAIRGAGSVNEAMAKLHASGGNHAVDVMLGGGSLLPFQTLRELQQRFGADLSDVRVHNDAAAHASAAALQANAYTIGSDIVFGANRFAPHLATGRHLITHEVAHVLQRRGDRAWFWGSVGKAPEGWSNDEKLLWQALGVSTPEDALKEGLYRGKGKAPKAKRKAPRPVNQWYQNEDIEGYVRDLRKGTGRAAKVKVEATSIACASEQAAWKPKAQVDFLKHPEYRVNVTTTSGERVPVRVTINAPLPPAPEPVIISIDPPAGANPQNLLNIVKGVPTGSAP